jgi:hypothetical protein
VLGAGTRLSRCTGERRRGGPTESGALTGMMGLTPEQAPAIKEEERGRIPLGRCGVPDDVAEWIVGLPATAFSASTMDAGVAVPVGNRDTAGSWV